MSMYRAGSISHRPTRCEDGRLMRFDPQDDDPYLETDVGQCEGCEKCQSHGTEEGDLCRRDGCCGRLRLKPVEGCRCFISPPCHACVSTPLHCPECHWESEDGGA